MSLFFRLAAVAATTLLFSCSQEPDDAAKPAAGQTTEAKQAAKAAAVDTARIVAADSEPGSWMSHGRTYDEQRYSPLKAVNDGNVGDLGLAWTHRLDVDRGTEATPIVVDGVMYTTGAYSIV